jgi:vacuolar-type H+-ATPase subunit E/Vma4
VSRPEDPLTSEIAADAEKRAARARQRAEREAKSIRQDAEREAQQSVERAVAEAEARAAHAAEISAARIEQELEKLRLTQRDEVVETVRDRARESLRELAATDEHRDVLLRLALLAIGKMSGHRFELVLRPADRERWGADLAEAVRARVGSDFGRVVQVMLADDTVDASGGLVVRTTDGHLVADQTFEARAERLWPQIRVRVATMLADEIREIG